MIIIKEVDQGLVIYISILSQRHNKLVWENDVTLHALIQPCNSSYVYNAKVLYVIKSYLML